MKDRQFYDFYNWLFFCAFLPFIGYMFLFLPSTILGFNLTGWAWLIMLLVTCYYFLQRYAAVTFPIGLWIPWLAYLWLYLLYRFSFPGLQLTLQYLVPLLVGVIASSFVYDREKLHWLYKRMLLLSFVVVLLFAFGRLFRGGWTPFAAATPMLLSVAAALSIGVFYMTRKVRFIVFFFLFFLVPFIDVTRMGILVFLLIFIFHFANRKVFSKIAFSAIGLLLVLLVFNSKGFQEKTFYEGRGELSDLSVNYYEPGSMMNTSGRANFLQFYEHGLKSAPLFGNGPRADMYVLKAVWGGAGISEAHNDYLSVRYNYGYVGLALLLFGFVTTFLSLYARFWKEKAPYRILLQSTTMILTLTFLIYMYSDNILKSTVFFTHFYFALLGVVYARFSDQA